MFDENTEFVKVPVLPVMYIPPPPDVDPVDLLDFMVQPDSVRELAVTYIPPPL